MVAALGSWPLGAEGASAAPEDTQGRTAVTVTDDTASEPASSNPRPCIVRADCAGGGLLVGPPLQLVVPATVLLLMALVLAGRVTGSAAALNPVLLTTRLDRPPQLFS